MLGALPAISGGISGGQGGITGGQAGPASADGDVKTDYSGRVNIQTGGGNRATGDGGMAIPVWVWAGGGVIALLGLLAWIQRARITAGK